MDPVLAALAAELREERSVISPHVIDPEAGSELGALAAAGPASNDPAYAAIVELVREGYLLHYAEPRLLRGADRDLALLAGDYMYAKGLERLAVLGDLEALRELSDLISLSAQLHSGATDPADSAPASLWLASCVAIAAGPSKVHERAKDCLRDGGSGDQLYQTASAAAEVTGLDQRFVEAAETVGFRTLNRG